MEENTLVCLIATLYGGAADEALFEEWEKLYLSNSDTKARFLLLADLVPAERRRVERDGELIARAERCLARFEESYGKHFALFIRERRRLENGVYRSFGGPMGALRELCLYLRGENPGFYSALRRFVPTSIQRIVALDHNVILGAGALTALKETTEALTPNMRGEGNPLCLSFSVDDYIQKTDVNEAVMFSLPLIEKLLGTKAIVCRIYTQEPKDMVARSTSVYRRMCGAVRGLLGCFKTMRNALGEKQQNFLSSREKRALIVGFFKASLPFFGVGLLFLASFFGQWAWLAFCFALVPAIFDFAYEAKQAVPRRGLLVIGTLLRNAFRRVAFMAYEAYLFIYVLCTAGGAPNVFPPRDRLHLDDALLRFSPSMMIGLVMFCLPGWAAKLMGALWMSAPVFFYAWSKEPKGVRLCADDRETLLSYARRMWLYFRDGVSAATHDLPPSYIRLFPSDLKADGVTPTDIGCYLGALLSARDLGFVDGEEFFRRCVSLTDTLAGLYKWHGFLFSCYHLHTLAPLGKPQISTKENGFFLFCILAFLSGLKEYTKEDPRLSSCVLSLETLVDEAEIDTMYDRERGLFFREYDVEKAVFSGHHQALFGGGFWMTYLAVSLGIIPGEAYFSLARPSVGTVFARGMASENGTAEELFLPALFLPCKSGFLKEICRFAWRVQRNNAVRRRIFGRSYHFFGRGEAPYFHFDEDADYHVDRFGLSTLACERCIEEQVISPHATLLMLTEAPERILSLCKRFAKIDAYGKYGFFDAIDLDVGRVGKGYAVIRRFSARGCGLGLLAVMNALTDGELGRRFCRMPRMGAFTHLFREEMPRGPLSDPPVSAEKNSEILLPFRKEKSANCPRYAYTLLHPDVALLSNNQTRILASSSGHVAVYSGSICIFPSKFDLFSLGKGLLAEGLADGTMIPFVPLGRRIAANCFSYIPRADEILLRGKHFAGGQRLETMLRLTVSPCREMFSVSLAMTGRTKNSRLRLTFLPTLDRLTGGKGALVMTRHEKENAVVFYRSEQPEIYLAVTSTLHVTYEAVCDGTVCCTASGNRVRFTFALSDDEDEALYLLSHHASEFDGGALRDLQYRAAGLSFSPWEAERFFLRNLLFGQIRPRTETYAHPDGRFLIRQGISKSFPLVLLVGFSDLPEQRERLHDLVALFKFLCIRGVRFQMVILHYDREEAVRHCLRRAGCEDFVSYQAGIFSVNAAVLSGAERFALELFSWVLIDLGLALSAQISENARAIPLTAEMELFLLQCPMRGYEVCEDIYLARGSNSASLRDTRLEGMTFTSGETLILRVRSRTGFRDYDLLSMPWRLLSVHSCACEGLVGDVRLSVEIQLTEVGEKRIGISLFTDSEVHLALIFGVVPVLGEEKRPPRFYRFRREENTLRVFRFSENTMPSIRLVASVPSQHLTERAALRSDGAVFRGENDMAALMTSMHLVGTAEVIFALIGENADDGQRYTET